MTSKHYPDVNPNPDFPSIEEKILAFWASERIFERSVESHPAQKDDHSNEFIFYDGPPFANGLPHYGHLLTGFVKDLFARYQTMKGKRVERRFGWDCHGLPAEMGAEKELHISGRQAIMKFGIGKFNDHCRQSVMKYTQEWQDYVTRQARWVDFRNDYKTMNITFMESVLWAFKQLYDKGLVYEAYRVMPYSWAAETPLSNFETRLDNSYREREDKAVTVAFELNTPPHGAPDAKYFICAWTTTPWTLPSNLALAVSKNIYYVAVPHPQKPDHFYIVGNTCIDILLKEFGYKDSKEVEIAGMPAESLIGLSYHPLFPYFAAHHHAFKILDGSDFVTDADGTGIVHMAPGFGEDDQRVCEAAGIEIVCPVDGEGKFTDAIYDLPPLPTPLPQAGEGKRGEAELGEGGLRLRGLNVICENVEKFKFGEANERIIQWLKSHGQLIKQETIKHNYPHCWRTDQPLIYRAISSWYVEVTKFRDRMVELNQQINWIPSHIRDGLFGKWLEGARDWSISRNRFWGTPIPVWRSKSGKIKVFGSIAELEKAGGKKIVDLHRPYIDEIVINEGGEEYRRVEDVFDCWFESGSMPYGQVHYPFENKDWFEHHFPADFIVEYQAQTRGWFYTLMVLGTALFDKPPFKNCICHGVVLDDKGQKLSKRLNNYADPNEIFKKFGADALRWFMMASPVMRGDELHIDKEGKFIRDVVRLAIKPIWNAYNFFCLYANADGVKASVILNEVKDLKIPRQVRDDNVMDRYILAKCKQAVEAIGKAFDNYDTPGATDAISQFFEALNNWYIRRNKERFWKSEHDADKQAAYDTLYTVLTTMCRAAAPLLPLTCEEIYKGLTGEVSVHLADWPATTVVFRGTLGDLFDAQAMDRTRDICNAALSIRNNINIRVRQPLASLTIYSDNDVHLTPPFISLSEREYYLKLIADEVNVKEIKFSKDIEAVSTKRLEVNPRRASKRKEIAEKMKSIIPASKKGDWKLLEVDEFKGITLPTKVEVAGVVLENTYFVRDDGEMEYEFSIKLSPKNPKGTQALSTNDALVILDTTVTPELEAEGIARDMVRMIQQARKDANLNVSDRIWLHVDAGESIAKAMQAHKDYIMEQTLAVEFSNQKPEKPAFTAENTLDDQKVIISLAVAA